MKKALLLFSAIVMAALSGLALAQDQSDRSHDRGGARPAASAPAPRAQPAPPSNRAEAGHHSMQREQAGRAANPSINRSNANRNGYGNSRGNVGHYNNRSNLNRGNNRRPEVGRNNNRPGSRPNYSQYHRNFSAPRRYTFRGPVYRRPQGWYSRRWAFGDFLPGLFWTNNYWIDDYFDYGLMPPPPGTVWVRYGSDAILIDRFTGEIIQVEYNIFF